MTLNPAKDTALVNMVSALPCAQAACTTLSPTTPSSAALVHLPKQVTLQAPDSLQYGHRYSIDGTARPGDHVMLQVMKDDETFVESPWASAARADGTFVVRATIRSGFGEDNKLIRPAAAHYGVAAREGHATVLAVASNATHVAARQADVQAPAQGRRQQAPLRGTRSGCRPQREGAHRARQAHAGRGNGQLGRARLRDDRTPDREGQPARDRERARRGDVDLRPRAVLDALSVKEAAGRPVSPGDPPF